ncbi:DUF1648 domain-containing protein [Thermococcus sp. GR7]|uniref:DUF1648 domain-containing protein n=1 Tax=unclassified Thermococcus TaxID=2627626 RepID=UPI001432097D|nr:MULTISPECIES: DUF1648 domain-containing protein [unclassified Thermococcus]NJE45843.1 DUF1648 domain-containing protein [Thermococcus sp. GR7]NJE79195.1 DUF1648 domain-containing protein [Thermococcus sp. GR4]NJF22037.1 DUF1648 domain-containing protein [Thermococcus sp. GR5]
MEWVELYIVMTLFVAGLLTFAFRNKRQYFIGFRIGYTYQSDDAWRKANTFAGIFMMALSLFLLVLAIAGVSLNVFVLVMIAGILLLLFLGTLIAKKAYEIEDLSNNAPERPTEPINVNVRPYIIVQLSAVVFYLVLTILLWDKLPEKVAIHFNASGEPDNFASKEVGAIILPLIAQVLPIMMTLLLREPGFAPQLKFSEKGWMVFAELMTLVGAGIAAIASMALLYNAGLIPSNWITYGAFVFLTVTFVGIYRTLSAR